MERKEDKKRVKVEQIGGFVGFGSAAHLRSEGEVDLDQLPDEDRQALERLLARPAARHESPRSFGYRLSWKEDGADRSIEVDPSDLPASVLAQVKDRLI
jgi:hypothetical protein